MGVPEQSLYRPPGAMDVLRLPVIGRMMRWRWGRLVLQLPLFVIAILLTVDGFIGPQIAAQNLATVAPWTHYRGLVVIVLLLAGNFFCMGCPFTLSRTLAKRLSVRGRRFPRPLRNKWLAIAGLFVMFFLYEWLDLWASPLLTAWVIVFYFVASFVMEAYFTESAFCKYVCPLGTFNFVYSAASPTQIGIKDSVVCATCVGKECVNGSYAARPVIRIDAIAGGQKKEIHHGPDGTPGCGTLLFPPQIKSNLDCTVCLDCVRACPHDNVGLMVRPPGRELFQPTAIPKRWDVSLLLIFLAFMGITNSFGMVAPIYELQQNLALLLNTTSEFPILLLIFGFGNIVLPFLLTVTVAAFSNILANSGRRYSLRDTVAAFAPAFVPIGFAVWFSHYSFHLLIGPFTIIPVFQEFLGQTGEWQQFSFALDSGIIGLLQMIVMVGGFLWSMMIAYKASLRLYGRNAASGFALWGLFLLGIMLVAIQIFSQPMEMRGVELFLN